MRNSKGATIYYLFFAAQQPAAEKIVTDIFTAYKNVGFCMSEHSKIECTDATWNPTRGCTKISPGCAHCYAEVFAERFRGVTGHPYEQGFDLRLVPEKLDEPLKWKTPRRVFVNSMSDLFHEEIPDDYMRRWSM